MAIRDYYRAIRHIVDPKYVSPDWKPGNPFYEYVQLQDKFSNEQILDAWRKAEEKAALQNALERKIKELEERIEDAERNRGGGFFEGLLGGYIGSKYFGRK